MDVWPRAREDDCECDGDGDGVQAWVVTRAGKPGVMVCAGKKWGAQDTS